VLVFLIVLGSDGIWGMIEHGIQMTLFLKGDAPSLLLTPPCSKDGQTYLKLADQDGWVFGKLSGWILGVFPQLNGGLSSHAQIKTSQRKSFWIGGFISKMGLFRLV